LLLTCLLLSGVALSGCAGAPVQEMSNARQAVKAAERAGAATTAPQLMGEARQLLKSAESHLRQGDYRDARDEAELARTRAVEARRVAEAAAQPPSQP
jgi:predicted S18 family serine protease